MSRVRYQRIRDAVPSGVRRRRPAPRRCRRAPARPARAQGPEPRPGRAPPRRDRHRRRAPRRARPRRGLRPRPPVEDAGHHGHQLDPGTRRPDPPRHRRHLAPPSRADRAADLPLRAPQLLQAPRRPLPEGLRRARPPPRVRHPRDLRRPRPAAVLPGLRDGPHPDVLPHRPLGRRPEAARRLEVHPLHAARLRDHAAGAAPHRTGERHLRHGGTRH